MSLIWRSILEVETDLSGDEFVAASESVFFKWVSSKFASCGLPAPAQSEARNKPKLVAPPLEFSLRAIERDGTTVCRGVLFEDRREPAGTGEQVRTTFTAIAAADGHKWVWTDLDRWSTTPYDSPWVPKAPRFVSELTGRDWAFSIGRSRVEPHPSVHRGKDSGRLVGERLLASDRTVPVVVVTPTNDEGQDLQPALRRAEAILKRLTGIAAVAVIDRDATFGLSETLDASLGRGFPAFGGTIRAYLPGLRPGDYPGRHRWQSPNEVAGRPTERVADLIAPAIAARSTEQHPPAAWTEELARLVRGDSTGSMEDELWEELERAEKEIVDLKEELDASATAYNEQAEEISRQVLINERLRAQFETSGVSIDPDFVLDDVFGAEHPQSLADLTRLLYRLEHVRFPEDLWGPAEDLDTYPDKATYAREAWVSILALEQYGRAQASDGYSGDFRRFCMETEAALPPNRVVMKESETTGNSSQFRSARTFTIEGVDRYMEPHIRIAGNQPPAPRLHFFDDTSGESGSIWIGYLGKHLDNKSKN